MTRINTIPVEELTDQHLMAEYRELPMINASLKRTLNSKSRSGLKTIPDQYTLNQGHVKYFYNKGLFLKRRYEQLINELRNRNYNIDPESRSVDWSVFQHVSYCLNNDWQPSTNDHKINVERLLIRINQKLTWYRYYGNYIDNSFVSHLEEKYLATNSI